MFKSRMTAGQRSTHGKHDALPHKKKVMVPLMSEQIPPPKGRSWASDVHGRYRASAGCDRKLHTALSLSITVCCRFNCSCHQRSNIPQDSSVAGKVKLSLCSTKHHATKTYQEAEVQSYTFSTSALDGGEWWTSHYSHFAPAPTAQEARWTLEPVWKLWSISCPCQIARSLYWLSHPDLQSQHSV
jgi:hypothetical protein